MASICSFHLQTVGYKFRAHRRLYALHAVVLLPGVARHLSLCSAFSRWLWFGRVLNVPLDQIDGSRVVRSGFIRIPVVLMHAATSHD